MSDLTRQPAQKESLPIPTLSIRPQTEEEEFEWLKELLLERMPSYKKHGYIPQLPDRPIIRQVIENPGTFDEVAFRKLHKDELYDQRVCEGRLKKIEAERETLTATIEIFRSMNEMWGFKTFDAYEILISAYGPGGSYNASVDNSRATAIVTALRGSGTKKNRVSYAETPAHEWVHCGVHRPIVLHYKLTHPEKERLVDLICLHLLGDLLPEYRVDSPPSEIDEFIIENLDDIPTGIEQYTRKFPR